MEIVCGEGRGGVSMEIDVLGGFTWIGDVLEKSWGGRARRWGTYGIEMAVSFAHCIEGFYSIICMQVEEEAFELWHLAVLRLVDFREPVDPCDPFFHRLQLFRRHAVAFIDHDHIGVGDLQVCGSHVQTFMLCISACIDRLLVQTQKYILRIDKRDDAVQVDCASQAIVDPKEGSKIAGVSEARCFEEDVVESASARHEGFDCIDAGVFDGAADAAVGQLEPFLRLLTVLSDCEGFLDIGGCIESLLADHDSCRGREELTITELYFMLAM